MPEPPRRKRFQFHLSTAIVMMFVAGGIMWLNVHMRIQRIDFQVSSHWQWYYVPKQGWPIIALERYPYKLSVPSYPIIEVFMNHTENYTIWEWQPIALCLDFLVALLLISLTWFVCEWRIRRNTARKET